MRRLSNSNVIIPTSDDDCSDEVVSIDSDDSSDGSKERSIIKNRAFVKKQQQKKHAKREFMTQCSNCAGWHESEACLVPRQNRQSDMRDRFATMHTKYKDFMAKKDFRPAKYNDWDRVDQYRRPGQDGKASWQDKLLAKRSFGKDRHGNNYSNDYWGHNSHKSSWNHKSNYEPTKRFKDLSNSFGRSVLENSA